MRSNIYRHELKSYRLSTIVWIVAIAGVAALFLSLLPPFLQDVAASRQILASLPEPVRLAFGIRGETFFTTLGFFAYILTYVLLMGAIQAMNLGTGIVSKEVAAGTSDFILSRPVTRAQIYTSKLLAALTLLLITDVIFVGVTYASAMIFATDQFSGRIFLELALILPLIQLWFLSLGLMVSMLIPKIRSVIAVTLPVVFGLFVLSMLDAILGIDKIRYLTPFRYYDTGHIVQFGAYEWQFLLIEAAVVGVLLVGAYVNYARKDMRI